MLTISIVLHLDRTEAAQNDESVENTRQVKAEPIDDQHSVYEKSVRDSTDSSDMSSVVSNKPNNVDVSATNSEKGK